MPVKTTCITRLLVFSCARFHSYCYCLPPYFCHTNTLSRSKLLLSYSIALSLSLGCFSPHPQHMKYKQHREASTRFMKETRQLHLKDARMQRNGERMQWQVWLLLVDEIRKARGSGRWIGFCAVDYCTCRCIFSFLSFSPFV